MNNKSKNKVQERIIRQNFLFTFFSEREGYEELNINGFWLVKHWDGNKKDWAVSLYSAQSFESYKKYTTNSLKEDFQNSLLKD